MAARSRSSGFNPRSRGGSDSYFGELDAEGVSFNPRSRGGSDWGFGITRPRADRFNPRSRGGSDRSQATRQSARDFCFNPRSRGGSDLTPRPSLSTAHMFQSTLPRGERLPLPRHHRIWLKVSIHAPAGGATMCRPSYPTSSAGFQSTLPRGERRSFPRKTSPN